LKKVIFIFLLISFSNLTENKIDFRLEKVVDKKILNFFKENNIDSVYISSLVVASKNIDINLLHSVIMIESKYKFVNHKMTKSGLPVGFSAIIYKYWKKTLSNNNIKEKDLKNNFKNILACSLVLKEICIDIKRKKKKITLIDIMKKYNGAYDSDYHRKLKKYIFIKEEELEKKINEAFD